MKAMGEDLEDEAFEAEVASWMAALTANQRRMWRDAHSKGHARQFVVAARASAAAFAFSALLSDCKVFAAKAAASWASRCSFSHACCFARAAAAASAACDTQRPNNGPSKRGQHAQHTVQS